SHTTRLTRTRYSGSAGTGSSVVRIDFHEPSTPSRSACGSVPAPSAGRSTVTATAAPHATTVSTSEIHSGQLPLLRGPDSSAHSTVGATAATATTGTTGPNPKTRWKASPAAAARQAVTASETYRLIEAGGGVSAGGAVSAGRVISSSRAAATTPPARRGRRSPARGRRAARPPART